MSIHTHITALEKKHLLLKERIGDEARHPSPDFTLITILKKRKLAIKEEMFTLNAQQGDMHLPLYQQG